MMRILQRAATLAGFCLVFAGLSMAQMGTFMGKVVGPDGKGMQGAVIKIERKDIKGNWQTKTNKKGEWIYSGMPFPGTFKVSCEVNGQVADAIDNVRSQLGDPQELNFDLKKMVEHQQQMQKAMESGQVSQEMARGMSAEQKAQMEKAMKEKSAAMQKNKALNDAFNAGMAALQAKDYQTAADTFTKAAEIAPKESAIWGQMAAAYEGLAASKTGADKDAALTKAGEAYSKALEIKPEDASLHNNYGLSLVKLKKLPEAKAELEKAAALDPPGAGKYFFNLGAVMVNTGQNDAALESFQKAVQADPNYADAWYYIGNVLSGKMTIQGDKTIPPPGMVEALEKYMALQPNGAHAEEAKGLLSVVQGTVQTTYQNPDAKKAPASKKKK